nr:unnamed protein product [Callosobruchus analis]
MEINIAPEDIITCYRIGKRAEQSTRGIYIKLKSQDKKQEIYSKKKMLKGAGVVVKEDLTATRLNIVNSLAEKIGLRNVWTINGAIYVFHNQKTQIIKNNVDLKSFSG